jgi:hypothetical protein
MNGVGIKAGISSTKQKTRFKVARVEGAYVVPYGQAFARPPDSTVFGQETKGQGIVLKRRMPKMLMG